MSIFAAPKRRMLMMVMPVVGLIKMKTENVLKMRGNCVAAHKEEGLQKSQLCCSVHGFIVDVTENVDECYVAIDTTNEIR